MGYWNYRVMRREADGSLFVHEVFYDEAGQPEYYSAGPAAFGVPDGDDLKGLIRNLLRAARNARTLPVLEPSDFERPEE
jgi:hypothetical protein